MDNEFLPDLYELEDENGNKQTTGFAETVNGLTIQ